MRKGIVFLVIGIFLILVSAPPLYLMGQEVLIQKKVTKQYKIENIYHPVDRTTDPFNQLLQDSTMSPFPEMKREIYVNGKEIFSFSEFLNGVNISEENQLSRIISFYDTEISMVDTFIGKEGSDIRENANVQIVIQGINYAEPVSLEIRPTYLDNNRYHGYLGMLKMTNNATKEERLIIVQRLFDDSAPEKDFTWKVISINKEGSVKTDIFTRDEIDNPAYRRDLIFKATVSPYALGYKSNILHSYPSLIYPVLYPFGTIVIGIILLVIGVVFRKQGKKMK